MDMNLQLEALSALNQNNPIDCPGDIIQLIECNLRTVCEKYNIEYADISTLIPKIHNIFDLNDETPTYKYIALNYYFLEEITNKLNETNEELNAKQNAVLRNVFKNLIALSINSNLLPNMPQFVEIKSDSFYNETDLIMIKYNRLCTSTYGLFLCMQSSLRITIFCDHFQSLLNALYQLIYCPIKKPGTSTQSGFQMRPEIYKKLLKDRELFHSCLENLSKQVNASIYVKETMLLLQKTDCVWFKKAVAINLTKILTSPKGLETISTALIDYSSDYDPNDSAKTWKPLDLIIKLIMSLLGRDDFESNICGQVRELLGLKTRNGEHIQPFEMLFLLTTRRLYEHKQELCRDAFLNTLLQPLINLSNTESYENGFDITDTITQSVRLLHSGFVIENDLPLVELTPVINVIFRLYAITVNRNFDLFCNQLTDLLIKYLKSMNALCKHGAYDSFMFSIYTNNMLPCRNDISINNKQIIIKKKTADLNLNDLSNFLLQLLVNSDDLLVSFFIYLLNCLNNKDKYFKMNLEESDEIELQMQVAVRRNFLVLTLLSTLSENKVIQNDLNNNPKEIIQYISNTIKNTIDNNCDPADLQTMIVVVMIVQALLKTCMQDNLSQYNQLLEPLKLILMQSSDVELNELIKGVIDVLENRICGSDRDCNKIVTELDKAIEEVCDSLLPVRGHGLMTLAKLVEKKEAGVLGRKFFILNIFQQNLKNDDSFIYLNAINGLVAMSELLPELVLNKICDEFLDYARKDPEDGNELRMKVGEVLVRIIKKLGDKAPKYKALLLNTFLVGIKDDDHLIRASSLSNLGEICRVLGCKLGPIAKEILWCVYDIINNDPAIEARRAGLSVLRQLFHGLGNEVIGILNEDIVPIFKTLQSIYTYEQDDIMRLHTELILEEFNKDVLRLCLNAKK